MHVKDAFGRTDTKLDVNPGHVRTAKPGIRAMPPAASPTSPPSPTSVRGNLNLSDNSIFLGFIMPWRPESVRLPDTLGAHLARLGRAGLFVSKRLVMPPEGGLAPARQSLSGQRSGNARSLSLAPVAQSPKASLNGTAAPLTAAPPGTSAMGGASALPASVRRRPRGVR